MWSAIQTTALPAAPAKILATVVSEVNVAWIGNSVQVAVKQYLQVTDDHFAQAVQNPVQHTAAGGRAESQKLTPDNAKPAICCAVREEATPCENTESSGMGDTGLEPVTSRV